MKGSLYYGLVQQVGFFAYMVNMFWFLTLFHIALGIDQGYT
jgi:hypothetical protein